jgi:hypothetical protein
MNRENYIIPQEKETALTLELADKLLKKGFNADNTVIVTVSTDYSSNVGQLLRHALTKDGEVCDGFGIDVPYPDEKWDNTYAYELAYLLHLYNYKLKNKKILLVEAGVIRGSNYKFIIDCFKTIDLPNDIYTLALFENKHSAFKSDFVGEFYDNETQDLTFWWEKENNHWIKNNMKNIHLIETDKPSRLHITGSLNLYPNGVSRKPQGLCKNQHIYITNDEEIKEDWYVNTSSNTIHKSNGTEIFDYRKGEQVNFKIILTTDQDLIKDGVQAIDDEFLEWFVNNPSCEKVEIGEGTRYEDEWIDNEDGGEIYQHQYCCYKIIIPKEEPTVLEEAKQRAANYMLLKGALNTQYVDFSNPNADKISSASTTSFKQETLEEVTKQIKNECHNFTKLVVPNVSYQDATNTFLFMKLAELTLKIQNYEK